jgi:hypothetical protein
MLLKENENSHIAELSWCRRNRGTKEAPMKNDVVCTYSQVSVNPFPFGLWNFR